MNRRVGKSLSEKSGSKFGRYLLISIGVHLLIGLIVFIGTWENSIKTTTKEVVSITAVPVMKPKASPKPAAKTKPTEKTKKKVVKKKTTTKKPQTETKKSKKKTVKETVKKKEQKQKSPVENVAAKKPSKEEENRLTEAIEKIRRQQEIDLLKQKLAELETSEPVIAGGGQKATGTEAGVGVGTWLGSFLKRAWSLSKYQVTDPDLEALAKIVIEADGRVSQATIIETSGDTQFDESVDKALRKLETIPIQPGKIIKLEINFNLKDFFD